MRLDIPHIGVENRRADLATRHHLGRVEPVYTVTTDLACGVGKLDTLRLIDALQGVSPVTNVTEKETTRPNASQRQWQ